MKIKRQIAVPSLRSYIKDKRSYNKAFAPDGVSRMYLHYLRIKNTSRMSSRYRKALMIRDLIRKQKILDRFKKEKQHAMP